MAVGGVILDESALLEKSSGLLPAAHPVLRKLRHSNIPTGISYGPGLEPHKVRLLKEIAMQYSIHCFILDASFIDDAINEVILAWCDIGGSILFLASDNKKDIFPKLSNRGWLVAVMNVEGSSACESSSMVYINKLQELPLTICHLNKKATGNSVVTVGYIMKPSREEDFAKRGAFPMCPTQNGLIFMPLTFELPLPPQLQEVDVLLHKATDEILSIDLNSSLHSSNKITYSRGMQELQRYMEHHQDLCVIDPLNSIYPVLDRLKIQQILLALEDLKTGSFCAIRGPHYLKVDDFNQTGLTQMLSEAKLALPSIVKPQVACGVADAHSMAIVFRVEDFKDLTVPLPAIIQEYVDHSSTLYKFYVLGEKVYHAVKNSTPNADTLMKISGSNEPKPLLFDSLKSLPTSKQNPNSVDDNSSKSTEHCLDLDLVTTAADFLMRKLELTVFGFDVVIQEGTGDHVIVDVNYLPSFKEVPNEVAIPAFWDAIKKKFEVKGRNK
ncbi:putative phosphotransferase with an alcohol group as acceptor [Rosa chinensis]|uniref:inositol-1,3,4-trisphosphate 5/6-kinase n=1 Tax=Rosa chinensis TaxID=74649 RepID=A0A2P6RHV0_ROSCH|nr:inositol 1,3,4-trisphosphate 5/6-kinase 4 [Rosa chinensis]PRQ46008.1 putative phosphotransferase with an alcohol group as acceptor [Rosa chinensis]